MDFVLFTNSISPHQLPLSEELTKHLGADNFHYIYMRPPCRERQDMGWEQSKTALWCRQGDSSDKTLYTADFMLSTERNAALFNSRLCCGKTTCYMSERWFKPPVGILRLLSPHFFKMAFSMIKLFKHKDFYYLPMGIHAARDMARLHGIFNGSISCLFHAPRLVFEAKPCGRVFLLEDAISKGVLSRTEIEFARKHGFAGITDARLTDFTPAGIYGKMRMWGYFVAPSSANPDDIKKANSRLRILWAGRMLDLKNVKTLVKAVRSIPETELDLFGHGPMEKSLKKLSGCAENIRFHDFVPIQKVRQLMHEYDIYVLPSNAFEGWGAVVSEALEEKMTVYASFQSGAGATMLPVQNLFDAKKPPAACRTSASESPPQTVHRPLVCGKCGKISAGFFKLTFPGG